MSRWNSVAADLMLILAFAGPFLSDALAGLNDGNIIDHGSSNDETEKVKPVDVSTSNAPGTLTGTRDDCLTTSQPVEIGERKLGSLANLPRPSSTSVGEFEKVLFEFLHERRYQELGWSVDKTIRDTGPFIKGRSYGTHPAVRVYYSPEIIVWLMNGRIGTIPDGAMMIKEQYHEPAVQHVKKTESELRASMKSWTVMFKDSQGSHDGWFWSNPFPAEDTPDRRPKVNNNHLYPFPHPDSGFGHYCIRCHAATQSPQMVSPSQNNEFTFAALRNISGFPGEPIIFRVDDSWRETVNLAEMAETEIDTELDADLQKKQAHVEENRASSHPKCTGTDFPEQCELEFNSSFAKIFDQIPTQKKEDVMHLPPETHDWVTKAAGGKQDMITSNQCMSCHAGLVGPFGPSMFIAFEDGDVDYRDAGWHVSPFGEWRWSPMGLAGRDPIFYSQLESEVEILKREFADDPAKVKLVSENLTDTCLRCHGAMGKHQFDQDKQHPDHKFSIEHVHAIAGPDQHIGFGDAKYGALARDGISCIVCHRSQPRVQPADDTRPYLHFYLETSITGNVHFGPPNEIYGPFKDDEISTYAMEHGVAIKPKYSEYIQSSQMCGTCHTVSLPVIDEPFGDQKPDDDQASLVAGEVVPLFKKFHHHVEQATYLEWLNSEFENEFDKDNPKAQSCQDCHMSTDLVDEENNISIEKLQSRIAAIQDDTYPDAENLTNHKNLEVRIREEGFKRHNFVGLNVFLLELFRQFDEILGVRKHDFMTGSSLDIDHAVKNFKHQARHDTVDLDLNVAMDDGVLNANLDIKNKVGHRFPSGVGFRRAFVELLVVEKSADGEERIVWGSGRTDRNGILVDADGQHLKTEFFESDDETGRQVYQPHHEVITSEDEVQIYETLLSDTKHQFTTSFIHGSHTVKDNRLLPRGWKATGPDAANGALAGAYLKATHPGPDALADSRYTDGSGSDAIQYRIKLPDGVDPSALTVKAAVYYQAIPPYFLKNLFENAPDGPATRRLHYMISNANVSGTLIEDWKLLINLVEAGVAQ